MTRIAPIGAGGEVGSRAVNHLRRTEHEVRHVELNEAGRPVEAAEALDGAEPVLSERITGAYRSRRPALSARPSQRWVAIVFRELPNGTLPDGAKRAVEKAEPQLFQPDSNLVFEPEAVRQSILDITQPQGASSHARRCFARHRSQPRRHHGPGHHGDVMTSLVTAL